MSSEPIFVDGLRAKQPHDNAPDFIKCALRVNRDELIRWLEQQADWIEIDIKEAKNGTTWYAAVNTFKPDPNRGQQQQAPQQPADDRGDIPF